MAYPVQTLCASAECVSIHMKSVGRRGYVFYAFRLGLSAFEDPISREGEHWKVSRIHRGLCKLFRALALS